MDRRGAASTWLWIIGGLAIGITVIALAMSISSGMFRNYQENQVMAQYSDLVSRAQSVCNGGYGNIDFVKLKLPDIVRAIYPADSSFEEPPDKVSQMITDKESAPGEYICLKFFHRDDVRCSKISCKLNMSYVGAPSLKEDLFTILSKIRGAYPTYTYSLAIEKGKERVYVLRERKGLGNEECEVSELSGVNVAGTCGGEPVLLLAKDNRVAILGDAYQWNKDNSEFNNLLKNIHQEFGGKTLIIWGEEKSDPEGSQLMNKINADSLRHDKSITSSDLSGYGQVWLVRPGWCEACHREGKNEVGCGEVKKWTQNEISAVVSFVENGGKLLLITDSGQLAGECQQTEPEYMPTRVVNNILNGLGVPFQQGSGYVCKSEKFNSKSGVIPAVGQFDVKYSAKFTCRE